MTVYMYGCGSCKGSSFLPNKFSDLPLRSVPQHCLMAGIASASVIQKVLSQRLAQPGVTVKKKAS